MKKEEPILVAIQCLVYNHEPYLRDCFEGFVMQKTNFRFVAIVHEDVSTDHSADIIREYEKEYPDIFRPIYETENQWSKHDGSLERIMNNAIDATGAKYVATCEGDDYWTDPLKLQKQVDYMEAHPECGLCITDFCVQDDLDKEHIGKPAFSQRHLFMPRTFEEHLQNAGYIGPMTWMYKLSERKRKTLDFNDTTDGSFAFALHMFAISKIDYLPDVTAVYRVHQGSAANPTSVKQKFTYTFGVFQTQLEYAKKYHCDDSFIDILKMQNYTTIMPLAIESNNQAFIDEALDYFSSKGMIMKWFVNSCKEYVKYKNQYLQIRSSKAYRLGKILLKPFKFLRRKR